MVTQRTLSNFINLFRSRSTSSLSTVGKSNRGQLNCILRHFLHGAYGKRNPTVGPLDDIVQHCARCVAHGAGLLCRPSLLFCVRWSHAPPEIGDQEKDRKRNGAARKAGDQERKDERYSI